MARWARRPRATNATIKAFYARGRILASQGIAGSLKLSMMGFGKRGGYLLKQEKLRRKMPKQNPGRISKTKQMDEGWR